jgi:hypothetical protein
MILAVFPRIIWTTLDDEFLARRVLIAVHDVHPHHGVRALEKYEHVILSRPVRILHDAIMIDAINYSVVRPGLDPLMI